MKQFLAVAALDETAVKQNEMLKNSRIYTEGFTVLRHEHMEFSVLVDGELYNQRSLHEELQKAGFPKPAGFRGNSFVCVSFVGRKSDAAYGRGIFLSDTSQGFPVLRKRPAGTAAYLLSISG